MITEHTNTYEIKESVLTLVVEYKNRQLSSILAIVKWPQDKDGDTPISESWISAKALRRIGARGFLEQIEKTDFKLKLEDLLFLIPEIRKVMRSM